jgi:hypothetical protein
LRLPRNRVIEKLPDLVTLIHNGGRYIGIYLFKWFKTCFKSRALFGRFQLAFFSRGIDHNHPGPGGSKERLFDLFVFEMTGELVEFGTDADGIEKIFILSLRRQAEEEKDDWEKAEKGLPWIETSGQCFRLYHLWNIRSGATLAAVYSEAVTIKNGRAGAFM